QRLGVDLPATAGWPFAGIRFIRKGQQADGDFSCGHALGLRRTILHEQMVERAAACGVALRWGAPVTGLSEDGVTTATETLRARWIIGADGARSRVRQWAALDDSLRYRRRYAYRRHFQIAPWSSRMEVHWSNESQAYITPLGADQVCVAVVSRNPQLRLAAGLQAFPGLRARLGNAVPLSAERGAATSMHSLRRGYRGRVALLGDASVGCDAVAGAGP